MLIFTEQEFEIMMELNSIPLKTMRPLIYSEISLLDSKINPENENEIIKWIRKKIDSMLEIAKT
jgi:Mre11 DNA-binding presumed domain